MHKKAFTRTGLVKTEQASHSDTRSVNGKQVSGTDHAGRKRIMGKSAGSAPPAPDYAAAATATASGNQDALSLQTTLNRVNQTSPWGSTTYSQPGQTFDESGYNAAVQAYKDKDP